MKSKLTTAIFLNHCFDKRRFQSFLYWFFKKSHSGQSQLLHFLEKLKFLGFHSATQAGFSISIDDLKIPSPKSAILFATESIVFNADLHLISGHLTTIEHYQRIIEIWNRTSEKLKYQVLQSFQISDFLNPVYLMAFSGARGNISQIRQLVGMRGLMADPQGKIIDFPIRSNFREGLTLTEYLISCSGARKGIVDTALRTAASGYLTRRLVDVAHHVIISQIDCQQVFKPNGQGALPQSKTSQYGIWIEALYDQQKEILPLQQRLIGRILAETIVHDLARERCIIGIKDQEITQITSQKICKYRKKVLIRSPLTCQSSKFICQLCYGWNLSEGQLVSVGEAVGVLAAQSIGEPGTQLTMRTFHTGGVFTGRLIDQTYAPFFGTAHYHSVCNGLLIRTVQGRIAYLSKNSGILSIHPSKKRVLMPASRACSAKRCSEQHRRAQPSAIIAPFLYSARYRHYLANSGIAVRWNEDIRFSYFILEKLRFTFNQFDFRQFKVKFERKPIYSNFLLASMSDFKAKNKSYFQKIKTGLAFTLALRSQLLCKSRLPYNRNAITGFSNQTSPRISRDTDSYPIFPHSQAFVYQFKKLSCQLKEMVSLNQTWLNLWVTQDRVRSPERAALEVKGKASFHFSSNPKNQKYKFTNTCRFNFNFIFNISQIYQKKLQMPRSISHQTAQKIGWSAICNDWRYRFRDTTDPAQYLFKKRIQFVFQIFTLLYVRQGENVVKTQLIAELPFFENEKSLENEQEILSNESGEIYFENFVFLEKTRSNLKTGSEITKIIKDYVQGLGEFWILFGRSFQHLLTTKKLSFFRKFDLIDASIPFAQIQIEPHNFLNGMSDDLVLLNNFIQIEQFHLFSRRKKIPLCFHRRGQSKIKTQLPPSRHNGQDVRSADTILQKFSRTFQIHLIFFKNSGYLQIPFPNIQALSIATRLRVSSSRPAQANAFNQIGLNAFVQNCKFLLLDRISKKINSSFLNQNFNLIQILTQSQILNGTYSSSMGLSLPYPSEGKRRASKLNAIPSFNLAVSLPRYQEAFVPQDERQEFVAFLPRQTHPCEKNKNCVDKIFWKNRKNYQKLLNKSFATWIIGLQRQSKYIPKYSDFRQQFFKISRKHFYLQFLKNSQSNFHPIGFLNLQKQKRNFFFKDTSFRIQRNSQKLFCEFQNQTVILSQLGRNITNSCLSFRFSESECKKIHRIQLPFFFHENTCLLWVNRQGISQFFSQEIIPNSATFHSISRYCLHSEGQNTRMAQSANPNKIREVKSIIRLTSKSININFHSLFLNLQVLGFCKVSFRMGTKKCWKVPKISENQLPKFWIQMSKGQFVDAAKKKLNIYHWLSSLNQQSRHSVSLGIQVWPMFPFFRGSPSRLAFGPILSSLAFPSDVNMGENQRQNQPRENIQSVFCTLFLKQSKLFQNLPKNWKRQITNAQPKIIHWNDLPYPKYIFLISFLKELHRKAMPEDLYRFIRSKNLKTVPGIKDAQNYRKILPFQKFIDFRIVFRSSKKFDLKNLNNFDWKMLFWKIQQRQDIIGSSKWKMGFYAFIRIFFCILAPRSADKSIHPVHRLAALLGNAKTNFHKVADSTNASLWQISCFKNLLHQRGSIRYFRNLTKIFLKNRYPHRSSLSGNQYQYSLFRQKMSQKFVFNKEKLSTLTSKRPRANSRSVNPKNWTLFSNFFIPKQSNVKWLVSRKRYDIDKRLSTRAHHKVMRPTEIKHANTESTTGKEIILNRYPKFASFCYAKRGFSIYTRLWTSKFIDFLDFRSSFSGDEKLKNNFQNIQLGSPNEILGQYDSNSGNQFDISYQWKFFGDCVTIMEQKLYPTYFQNFSCIENDLNVKKKPPVSQSDTNHRVVQNRIKDLQLSIASDVDLKTQIPHRGTIYPSLDKVLKNFFQTSTTITNKPNKISGTKAAVFLLNKILPKSLFSLESGIFKNRILPFYNQIESSKLQKYILDFYFGSYCHILQNFSLFKNFTRRFCQNQPKKPIYNMFSVTMGVDKTQFILKYNFKNKVQKTGSKIKDGIIHKVTSIAAQGKGPTPSENEARMDKRSALGAKGTSASTDLLFNQHPSIQLAMPTNRRRSRIEQFDQCLKTKFHNSELSKKQIQSPLNPRYSYPRIGELKSVVYQIRTGSNNKNELNKIRNNIFGSNDSMTQVIEKNTIHFQKSDIQHFFEYETSTECEFHNFYIEYISKKSSLNLDDFFQIRNFHKLNMKSWLNREKNFQKYSVRYLKSKFISKKFNLFRENFDPIKADKVQGLLRDKRTRRCREVVMPDLFYKKILNKTLFVIQQLESQQVGHRLSKSSALRSCCFILKFSRENWDNFYSIYLNYPLTYTKGQNRKFFRFSLILNPKQKTYNPKNITLNNFIASKLQYCQPYVGTVHPFVMKRKLHFKILSIIQTLLFVYRYYHITLARSNQNISRRTLRSRILTELKTFSPKSVKNLCIAWYRFRDTERGSDRNQFPPYSRATLKKEYFNSLLSQTRDVKFLSYLKFPIVYMPLFDQNYEIFLTSIMPLTLNLDTRRRLDSDKEMQYKTSIFAAIPKIWDRTHFLKIHIIQTKRLEFLNPKSKTPFGFNPENKDVCNYQIIKKNDLHSFEIQILIRFFFPFPLGEIVDLSQKTKSLLFTNIEDFFSYHNHWPITWTDLNVQNYKLTVFLDDFFNLFDFQSKNKTKKNFANTFLLKNKPIFVSICDSVSKVQFQPTIIAGFRLRYKKVGLGFDFIGLYRDRKRARPAKGWLRTRGVQKCKLPKIANHTLRRFDRTRDGLGSDGGKLKLKSKINLSLHREAQMLVTLARVKLDLKIQLFQKPNHRLLNKQYFQTSLDQACEERASLKKHREARQELADQTNDEVLSTLIHKHLRPSFQKNIIVIPRDTEAIAKQDPAESSLLGSFMKGGQEFNAHQFSFHAGQLIAKTGHVFLYRKATTHLLNHQSILHVQHGEIIVQNQRLYSVFYSQSKTGDIVQGIPKIEEIFEARKKSKYSLHELPIFSKDFLFFEKKITKYLQSLQKSVVNSIQRIYCGQGIHISDKHIEIIVRQMTSNVIILEPGQTGLLCGEIVALHWVRRTNSLFTSNQVIYEPIFLGMTKTCLETSSFLSAASFQETTRILSRAALQNQIDFIRGLKQNVILGNLIPIGTGYFK